MPDLLWAVHIQGPDDIIAVKDRADADQRAKAINDWYAEQTREPGFNPKVFPRIHAEVIKWPYSTEGHAEALRDTEDDDA